MIVFETHICAQSQLLSDLVSLLPKRHTQEGILNDLILLVRAKLASDGTCLCVHLSSVFLTCLLTLLLRYRFLRGADVFEKFYVDGGEDQASLAALDMDWLAREGLSLTGNIFRPSLFSHQLLAYPLLLNGNHYVLFVFHFPTGRSGCVKLCVTSRELRTDYIFFN
jgi:hypothetical protein